MSSKCVYICIDNIDKDSDMGYHENEDDDSGMSFDSVALHNLNTWKKE